MTRRERAGTCSSFSASRTPTSSSRARIAVPSISVRCSASSIVCCFCLRRFSSRLISSLTRAALFSSSWPSYGLMPIYFPHSYPVCLLSQSLHSLAMPFLVHLLFFFPSSYDHGQLLFQPIHLYSSYPLPHHSCFVLVELAGIQQFLLVSQKLSHILQLLHHFLFLWIS